MQLLEEEAATTEAGGVSKVPARGTPPPRPRPPTPAPSAAGVLGAAGVAGAAGAAGAGEDATSAAAARINAFFEIETRRDRSGGGAERVGRVAAEAEAQVAVAAVAAAVAERVSLRGRPKE
eukprot:scaffold76010_cov36-Phaeocystis_antarctica.AAC.1